MQWMVSENAGFADHLLMSPTPAASAQLKSLGRLTVRPVLRHLTSELSRLYLQTWGTVQIVLGALFFFFLLFGTSQGKLPLGAALLLFGIAVFQRVLITRELVSVGRALDFAANPSARAQLALQALQNGYTGTEIGKWILQLILAAGLIWQRGGRSGSSRDKVDLIDKSYDRHIDR